MRATKLTSWARVAVLCVFGCAASFAQTPAGVIVACTGGNCPTGQVFDDLQDAIDQAVTSAETLDQQVLLLVYGGPWTPSSDTSFRIPADANVRMLGLSFNEQQIVSLVNNSGTAFGAGDTFTLAFTNPSTGTTDTTTDLDFDATAAEVQAALEALTTIGAGNVTVTGPDGGPWVVDFSAGVFANVAIPLLVADDANLNGGDPDDFVLVVSNDGAFSTVIQGAGDDQGPVLVIEGETAAKRDAGVGRDRLVIEGLTFTNGTQGIRVNGGAFPTTKIQPILNRLYIRSNGDGADPDSAGVLVEGSADPLIVNSSISNNDGDGVRVDGVPADLTDVDILHCTIVGNDDNGVFVATGNDGRVRNTIVYANGSGVGEGGLVWEDNPGIEPESGPLDGFITGTFNPVQVTITGTNLDEGGATRVFFGPPANPATEATVNSQTDTQLVVDLPPAYNGIPGQVDVTIRRSDGFEIVMPNAFTYTADLNGALVTPIVWQVDPGWGPADDATTTTVNESAIDVYVLGAFFDRDCSVFFDLDDDNVLDTNEQSPRVQWISSGRLFVRVPTTTNANKVDVWVRNNPTGQVSPLGPLEDYEYRAGFDTPGPEIVSIVPNSIDTTAGSGTSTSSALLPDVIGADFVAGAIVKIGGIVCPYATFSTVRLIDLTVPVSQFGGGGVYDVEVINPDGRSDILPRGFSYFPTSTPGLDDEPWRPANFIEVGVGGDRTLLGHGLDFNVDLRETSLGTVFGNNIQPIAQREIPFTYPPDTNGLGLGPGVGLVGIDVLNVATQNGSVSTVPIDSTILVYTQPRAVQTPPVGGTVFFAINSVTITTVGATDTIQLDIENYRNQYEIWVGETQVAAADITLITAPNPPFNFNGVISFPAPAQPAGVSGPVDITVVSPTGFTENQSTEEMYFVAENAYSYRRTGVGEAPQISAVTPNTVPDNGTGPVQITGQNFIGPRDFFGTATPGVYTRVLIDPDGTYEFGTAAQDEIDLSAVATGYSIDSVSQISFTDFDLSAFPAIPRDAPLDLVVEQFDDVNNTVLTDTAGTALRSRLIGAITFQTAVVPPVVQSVANTTDLTATGPVSGSDRGDFQVTITGTNFQLDPADPNPIVLFGSAQAEFVGIVNGATDVITVNLPAAPNGLPGIYDVTVIRPHDPADLDPAAPAQGSLVDAFTYYMDGAPIITQVSPNHVAYDPANPPAGTTTYSITIYGYNFDDDVRVTFGDDFAAPTDTVSIDTINQPDRVRVVSPNEIVVQLTAANLSAILQAGDFAGGFADMRVTVQNRTEFGTNTAEAISLTSAPPTEFFAFSDARGSVSILTPELLYNDVYLNNQDDYINVSPGTGSISIDPVILSSPWIGKLLPDPVAHPLLSTAGPFTEDPYTLTDFELESRPQGDGAEIGADEISDVTVDVCSWYFARVTPTPVGITPDGDLLIEVQFNGNCGGTPFIVPQGGDPRDPDDRIALSLYQNPASGYYIYTNAGAISTLLDDRDGDSVPSIGDLIADGHAAVYMERGGNIIGFEDNSDPIDDPSQQGRDHLRDGGVVIGDAVIGRHFLIDTVPPRIHLEAYGGAIEADEIAAGAVVVSSNDAITANDFDGPTHPAGAPPAVLPYRPSIAPPPYWPSDDGGIYFRGLDGVDTIDDGLQVFFNRGSISNPDPSGDVTGGALLDMTIQIQLIDPPVTDPTDPTQTPVPGIDFYTGLLNRQVSGFPLLAIPADNLVEAAGGDSADNILFQGWASWFPDPTVAPLTIGAPKTATFETTDSDIVNPQNAGVFDPTRYPGDDTIPSPTVPDDPGNDALVATWSIADLAPSVSQAWRLRAQFVGEDLSLNTTTNATTTNNLYTTLFDPLQLWWMYDVASALSGPSNCETAPTPFYNVSLTGQRPNHTGEPYAAFTYNLYYSSGDCTGPYNNAIGWSGWSTNTSIDVLADLSDAEKALLNNKYVMIVSLGADEAGNVEPLRFDPATVDVNALPPNAKTFLFTNELPADTAVGLELWYDLNGNGVIDSGEPVFGDNPIVPYNAALRARYAVSVIPIGNATGPFEVTWEFHEDGVRTLTNPPVIGPLQTGSDVFGVTTPGPSAGFFITPTLNGGALGNNSAAVTYLFTAAAYYGIPPIADPTPASAYFVVVPAGVGDFVMPSEDPNKQPIKEQGKE